MKYMIMIVVILAILVFNTMTHSTKDGFDTGTSNNPLSIQGSSPTDTSFNIVSANQMTQTTIATPVPGADVLSFGQVPIPQSGIPDGYYQTGPQYMTSIPYGYVASADKQSILPQIQSTMIDLSSNAPFSVVSNNASNSFTSDSSNNITHYDPNNYNITFHADPQDNSSIYFSDICTNMVNATYYQAGSFPYGPSSWVPNYEDSVYLSKLTGYSSNSALYNTASQQSGFCVHYANNPQGLEEQCNKLDPNVCASTNCCVLLGGSKCVSGNQSGPLMKANYSDFLLTNRDYYYYNGKCYGNCSN
jgi:hypothetical protein